MDAISRRLRDLSAADRVAIRNWPPYPPEFAELDYALREDGWLAEFGEKLDTSCFVVEQSGELIALTIFEKLERETGGLHTNGVTHEKENGMKRALVVIDVQNEYFSGKLPVSYPPGSIDNILQAMDCAGANQVPVVVIQHTAITDNSPVFRKNSPEWALHPEIEKRHRETLIEKNQPDSFTKTSLDEWLKQNNIDTVTICGYMTHMCCDTTARRAYHLGYSVEFLSDATGTLAFTNEAGSVTAEELHRAILVTQNRFSKVMTTATWISGLPNMHSSADISTKS